MCILFISQLLFFNALLILESADDIPTNALLLASQDNFHSTVCRKLPLSRGTYNSKQKLRYSSQSETISIRFSVRIFPSLAQTAFWQLKMQKTDKWRPCLENKKTASFSLKKKKKYIPHLILIKRVCLTQVGKLLLCLTVIFLCSIKLHWFLGF